jgi:prenyltransferase beta subunit
MNPSSKNIPFYRQMIALLGNALDLLDEQGRGEVLQFLLSQQNADGGFRDRGGRSDLYYSLFGGLMIRAWSMESEVRSPKSEVTQPATCTPQLVTESKEKLTRFVQEKFLSKVSGFIERCCLVLLQKELKTGWISRIRSIFSLGRSFWKERQSINLSYRSFVLFLTLDAVFPFPRLLKFGAGKMLKQTVVDQHSPCSEVAARVFLQRMMNKDGSKETELLMSFACETGGFKAFAHLDQADMLSTAVALFALDFSGVDLRLLKPACLDFIQSNYFEGAFLSGDGDQTMDVEYTFYGLLALGVLAK